MADKNTIRVDVYYNEKYNNKDFSFFRYPSESYLYNKKKNSITKLERNNKKKAV